MPDTQTEEQQSNPTEGGKDRKSQSSTASDDSKANPPSSGSGNADERSGESDKEDGYWVWVPDQVHDVDDDFGGDERAIDGGNDNESGTQADGNLENTENNAKANTNDVPQSSEQTPQQETPKEHEQQSPQTQPSQDQIQPDTAQDSNAENLPVSDFGAADQNNSELDREGGHWVFVPNRPDREDGNDAGVGIGMYSDGYADDLGGQEKKGSATSENAEQEMGEGRNAERPPEQTESQEASKDHEQPQPQQPPLQQEQAAEQYQPFQQPSQQTQSQPPSPQSSQGQERQNQQPNTVTKGQWESAMARDRSPAAQSQTADNDTGGEGGGEDSTGDRGEEGEQPDQGQKKSSTSMSVYFVFLLIAIFIDVIIPLIGFWIFTAVISFALALIFKVVCYFFLPKAKDLKKRVTNFWLPAGADSIIDILPGNIAIVVFAVIEEHKEMLLKHAKPLLKTAEKAAQMAGRKDIAMAARMARREVEGGPKTIEQVQADHEEIMGGGRWKPPLTVGTNNLPGVAHADNKDIKKAA